MAAEHKVSITTEDLHRQLQFVQVSDGGFGQLYSAMLCGFISVIVNVFIFPVLLQMSDIVCVSITASTQPDWRFHQHQPQPGAVNSQPQTSASECYRLDCDLKEDAASLVMCPPAAADSPAALGLFFCSMPTHTFR